MAWVPVKVEDRVFGGQVFRARCTYCSWVGPKRFTQREALRDGFGHDQEHPGRMKPAG